MKKRQEEKVCPFDKKTKCQHVVSKGCGFISCEHRTNHKPKYDCNPMATTDDKPKVEKGYPCDIVVENELDYPFVVHIEDLRDKVIVHIQKVGTVGNGHSRSGRGMAQNLADKPVIPSQTPQKPNFKGQQLCPSDESVIRQLLSDFKKQQDYARGISGEPTPNLDNNIIALTNVLYLFAMPSMPFPNAKFPHRVEKDMPVIEPCAILYVCDYGDTDKLMSDIWTLKEKIDELIKHVTEIEKSLGR